jgi:uncharacterized protein
MERQDLKEAEDWLRKAAEAGSTPGQVLLGLALLQREDLEEAEAWLRKATEAGYHDAEATLNRLLEEQSQADGIG